MAHALAAGAAQLTESTFTEVVKDVNVVAQTTKSAAAAKVNDVVKAPDLVRTGAGSRAELTAPDQTITRVGANTIFSFEPAGRNIDLQQGSILFHSRTGKGGGSIRSGGASAAVSGTTIIVVATPGGGFKLIVLEGTGHVKLPSGKSATVKAGQLAFVLPGQPHLGPVLDINLGKLVSGSRLVNGFSQALPSLPRIQAAVEHQNKEIAHGRARDTGLPPGQFLGNGLGALDNNDYATFTLLIPGSPKSAGRDLPYFP